jgi:hypothetical protein
MLLAHGCGDRQAFAQPLRQRRERGGVQIGSVWRSADSGRQVIFSRLLLLLSRYRMHHRIDEIHHNAIGIHHNAMTTRRYLRFGETGPNILA